MISRARIRQAVPLDRLDGIGETKRSMGEKTRTPEMNGWVSGGTIQVNVAAIGGKLEVEYGGQMEGGY